MCVCVYMCVLVSLSVCERVRDRGGVRAGSGKVFGYAAIARYVMVM